MTDYFIYNHGGSANHGCEALVRTVLRLFGGSANTVYSEAIQQDLRYGIDTFASIKTATTAYSKISLRFLTAYWQLKTKKDYIDMDVLPYRKALKDLRANQVELSVGGDIYCYEDYRKFILLHRAITKRGCRSVLLGCSLEEKLFQDPNFLADLKQYDYISARESLTFSALQKAGFHNIGLTPDSAFTLGTDRLPLPEGFIENNTVGINLSPLAVRREAGSGIVMQNFLNLIHYILDHTDCSVALIPHVVWQDNDDRTVLKELSDRIACPERVVLIGDHNCEQLKGFIARCRFFVGARTHATIASYSSLVPTLVLGYSVKSRGVATDLFGTDEHYVLPVQTLSNADAVTEAFRWMMAHEFEIKDRLNAVIPGYVQRAASIRGTVEAALEG